MYKYQLSLDSFEIWAYRAKQIGLLHITEFYPDPSFHGKDDPYINLENRDKIVLASAVVLESPLITSDGKIKEYVEKYKNIIPAIIC
ncbi:MAG: hypothetical protein F6K47_08295 [Symploca sp. SIO2E6]|nr:hypothetical protein [Symploca sp. SIO2E6]